MSSVIPIADEVLIVTVGHQGPPGPVGPGGPAGGTFQFEQSAPSDIWTINHNLGYHPAGVRIIDSGGTNVEGHIVSSTFDTLIIAFSAPISGTAYLS